MREFVIKYTQPVTEQELTTTCYFEDTILIINGKNTTATAEEWCEDYAYTIADKGRYEMWEVLPNGKRKRLRRKW